MRAPRPSASRDIPLFAVAVRSARARSSPPTLPEHERVAVDPPEYVGDLGGLGRRQERSSMAMTEPITGANHQHNGAEFDHDCIA
jgi:hypothetical protein